MMMRTTTDMTCGYNIYNFSDKNHRGEELAGLSTTVATSGYKSEAEVQSVSHVG